MKLYILVEDGKSFYKILPSWLQILAPTYKRARTIDEMGEDGYVLLSGKGYPRLLGTDSEIMEKPKAYSDSTSIYHEEYLKNMLREKHIHYTKSNPAKEVQDAPYFEEMIKRIETTEHLYSFRVFVDFFRNIQDSK